MKQYKYSFNIKSKVINYDSDLSPTSQFQFKWNIKMWLKNFD